MIGVILQNINKITKEVIINGCKRKIPSAFKINVTGITKDVTANPQNTNWFT